MVELEKLPYCDKCGYWETDEMCLYSDFGTAHIIQCKDYLKCQDLEKLFRQELENNNCND